MSIQWQNFNEKIEFTPHNLVNEVRRITLCPPKISIKDFIAIYTREIVNIDVKWQRALVDFCIASWIHKLMRNQEDSRYQLSKVVLEKWNRFCDELPDNE